MRARLLAAVALTVGLLLGASVPAEAISPLEGRDINGNPVAATDPSAVFEYDPNLNVTWLRDWYYNSDLAPSGSLGFLDWDTAMNWAATLTVGRFGGWRLPYLAYPGAPGCDFSHNGTNCGYNVLTNSGGTVHSEMAYLWYDELGNLAYCPPGNTTCNGPDVPQSGWGLTNEGPFLRMYTSAYWLGAEEAPGSIAAWYFRTDTGIQLGEDKGNLHYAVAVRDYDVFAG